MTGRRRSRPPISTTPTGRDLASSPRSTTWPSRATFRCRSSASWACPLKPFPSMGRIFRRRRLSEGGSGLSDRITTVSPTYAREIMTPEFGMALDGLLRTRAAVVQGIVNGIDDTVWNPATDVTLPQNYSALRIDMRVRNKIALQTQMGLAPELDRPLLGVVSRLSDQKGLDLLLQALPGVSPEAANSRCSAPAIRCWRAASPRPPHRGQTRSLASSATMRSWPISFRPAPISSSCPRVSSLAASLNSARSDTAPRRSSRALAVLRTPSSTPTRRRRPRAWRPASSSTRPLSNPLTYALNRALDIARDPAVLRRLRLNGMRSDVSWRGPAKRYAALYRDIVRPAE